MIRLRRRWPAWRHGQERAWVCLTRMPPPPHPQAPLCGGRLGCFQAWGAVPTWSLCDTASPDLAPGSPSVCHHRLRRQQDDRGHPLVASLSPKDNSETLGNAEAAALFVFNPRAVHTKQRARRCLFYYVFFFCSGSEKTSNSNFFMRKPTASGTLHLNVSGGLSSP